MTDRRVVVLVAGDGASSHTLLLAQAVAAREGLGAVLIVDAGLRELAPRALREALPPLERPSFAELVLAEPLEPLPPPRRRPARQLAQGHDARARGVLARLRRPR